MSCASCGRASSSQKTAGAPLARARDTASFTQSRTDASVTRHMRHRSPAATSRSRSVAPALDTTRMRPFAAATNVLSCEPYSSAFCAMRPTFGTLPMVLGSKAPFALQSSITTW